jgi:pyruvate formate lyase activating enzyme
MDIYGFIPESFQDNEEGLTSVIFTPKCNFSCPACHGKKIVEGENNYKEEEILKSLERKARMYGLERLTITGGEPTLQKDLLLFLKKCKEIGLKVKLDTNGSNPEVLKEILDENLVDYVAMDIKGPQRFYNSLSGRELDLINDIEKGIALVQRFPGYEFRTTVAPALVPNNSGILLPNYSVWNKDYTREMGDWMSKNIPNKNANYFLQSFQSRDEDEIIDKRLSKQHLPREMWKTPDEIMAGVYNVLRDYLPRTKIR